MEPMYKTVLEMVFGRMQHIALLENPLAVQGMAGTKNALDYTQTNKRPLWRVHFLPVQPVAAATGLFFNFL